MAFVAAPTHPLMARSGLLLQALADIELLVRERGSGTRSTVEQLFKAAGVEPRIGAELSSNEAIKQMCAAGFGVAFLSLHACALEIQTGLLRTLPVADHPVEREWYVISLAGRAMPAAAVAFEAFLRERGQALIDERLGDLPQPARGTANPPPAAAERPAPRKRTAKAE